MHTTFASREVKGRSGGGRKPLPQWLKATASVAESHRLNGYSQAEPRTDNDPHIQRHRVAL